MFSNTHGLKSSLKYESTH